MKLGFTGTRHGLNDIQAVTLSAWIANHGPFEEAHHGDCIGADSAFHTLTRADPKTVLHIHPSDSVGWRAFRDGDVYHPEKPPLERNKDIVNASDMVLACPMENVEVMRSGTWATIRNCRKVGRTLLVFYPDGRVE